MIRECIVAAITLNDCTYQWSLVQVFVFFFVFIYPQFREQFSYLVRHQTGKNSVTGILCGSGQNAEIELLVYIEQTG